MNVLVQWRTRINPKTELAEYVRDRAVEQRIVRRFMDGRVETTSGDVWHVRNVRGKLVALPILEVHYA